VPRTSFFLLLRAGGLLALLWAGRARADGADLTPAGPGKLALGGDIGFFFDDQGTSTVYVLAPRIAAQYAFDDTWAVAGDFGAVMLTQSPDRAPGDETTVRPGNPTALALMRGSSDAMRYRFGLGGAAPLAVVERDGNGRLQRAAYDDAQGMSGLWDVWVWAPSRAAVVGYVQLGYVPHPEVDLEFEFAPALLIPAREAFTRDPVDVFLPFAFTLLGNKRPVQIGARFQAVLMPTVEPDMLQLTLEPIVRLLLGTAFVEARYTAPLDEPLAGERGVRTWAVHLAFGGSL
jgi:hypothetical protein